jgi:hypothetical protein
MQSSKHAQRRERRERYYSMLDQQLAEERAFVNRVVSTFDHDGLDRAHDGRPIKAHLFRYLKDRQTKDLPSSLACLALIERAVKQVAIKPVRRS